MSEHASSAPTARTTVRVTLGQPVDIEALRLIFTGIGGVYGCRHCGLLGIDVHISGDAGDPGELAAMPAVKSVSLG